MKEIHSPSALSRPVPSQSPNKSHLGSRPPLLLSPPRFLLLSTFYGTEQPFGHFGSAVPTLSPPKLLATPSLLTGQGGKEKKYKALALCKYPLATAKTPKLQSLISILVATNPKHSPLGCYGGGSSLHPSLTQYNIFTGSIK